MPNPFANLGKETAKPTAPKYEEWGGVFSCQTPGCYDAAIEAKYYRQAKRLTWDCPQGHTSEIEEFED